MDQLGFLIYDLIGNIVPGSILLYYLYIKFNSLIDLSFFKSIGGIDENFIVKVIFLIIAYFLGNGLDLLNNIFYKKILKDNSCFQEESGMDYEFCKKYIKQKSITLYGFQEKFEAKYLFFRNVWSICFGVSIYEANEIRVIAFIIGFISLVKFKKYWDLSGENLVNSYKVLREEE
ncbi:MAG: hypothetical protein ACRC6E_04885 [Fusobacteriaceae bacterium]